MRADSRVTVRRGSGSGPLRGPGKPAPPSRGRCPRRGAERDPCWTPPAPRCPRPYLVAGGAGLPGHKLRAPAPRAVSGAVVRALAAGPPPGSHTGGVPGALAGSRPPRTLLTAICQGPRPSSWSRSRRRRGRRRRAGRHVTSQQGALPGAPGGEATRALGGGLAVTSAHRRSRPAAPGADPTWGLGTTQGWEQWAPVGAGKFPEVPCKPRPRSLPATTLLCLPPPPSCSSHVTSLILIPVLPCPSARYPQGLLFSHPNPLSILSLFSFLLGVLSLALVPVPSLLLSLHKRWLNTIRTQRRARGRSPPLQGAPVRRRRRGRRGTVLGSCQQRNGVQGPSGIGGDKD